MREDSDDGENGYDAFETRDDVDGIVPIGKIKSVKLHTKDGVDVVKEKVVGKYRACLVCHLIASETQFLKIGCPNCPFLELQGSRSAVWDCTSAKFAGMLAVLQPEASWAARLNGLERSVPGCYAVEVTGDLPERVRDMIQRP